MSTWEDYKKTMGAPPTLWGAARENDLASLEALLAEGHDINALDHRGYSPLMLAAYAGHGAALEYLLAHGADPNSQDNAGNSILMGAAFKGSVPIVQRLLEAGADRSVKNAAGLDARAITLVFGRTEIVELLDKKGT